jgi:hypothetical protein
MMGGAHRGGVHHKGFRGHGRLHNKHFFSFGVGGFYPSWWWYDPYYYPYYSYPPAYYYPAYSGYPAYDYSGYPSYNYYDYYGDPYSSDPCLSSDPAYAPYCPPSSTGYPYGGEHGAPPVDYPYYPSPETQGQPETIGGSTSPAPPEQPTSTGGER